MELEWKWNGCLPTKAVDSKWNGNSMEMEWKWNGNFAIKQIDVKWNGNK